MHIHLQVSVNTSIDIKLCIYFSPRPRRCLVILYAQVKTVRGFEIVSLLRELSTHSQILQKRGFSFFSSCNPQIKTAKVTFIALVPVAGSDLWWVCYLSAIWMPFVSKHSLFELPGSAQQGRQALTAQLRICSHPRRHTHTQSPCSCLVSLHGDGEGKDRLPV